MEVGKSRVKIIVLISIVVLAILIAVSVAVNATGSSGIAKSKTFTDNMDGYYVYFRAVDEAGNAGDWSNAQRIWIDTTEPTITAKNASIIMKEEERNDTFESLFNITWGGITTGTIIYKLNDESTSYNNIGQLEAGTHVLTAILNKNNGTTASASVTVEVTAGVPTEETLLKTLNMEGEITVPEGVTCLKIIVNTTSGMPVPFIDIKVRWN